MRRFLICLCLAFSLAGCASERTYRHAGGADYYYGDPVYSSRTAPDYIVYDAYYAAMWPIYHPWYDPFFAPHFYYGVTWYPTNLFGFGYGYGYGFGGGWGWPYFGYSPWASSWWDGYYDWRYWDALRAEQTRVQRFGSVRNEAAAIAQMQRGDAPLRSGAFAASRSAAAMATVGDRTSRARGDTDLRDSMPVRRRVTTDRDGPFPTRGDRRDTEDSYYDTPRSERRRFSNDTDPYAAPRRRSEYDVAPSRSGFAAPMPSRSDRAGPDRADPGRSAPPIRSQTRPAPTRSTDSFEFAAPVFRAPAPAPAPRSAPSRGTDRR